VRGREGAVKGSKRLKCGRGKMEAFVLNKYIAEKGSITCTSYEILISCNMRFSVDKMFLLTFKKYCFERFIQTPHTKTCYLSRSPISFHPNV